MKRKCFYIFFLSMWMSCLLQASTRSNSLEQDRVLIRKVLDHVEMMRHELGNHEAELTVLQSKINHVEDAVEELRNLIDTTRMAYQDQIKNSKDSFEHKVSNVIGDMKTLQKHANNSSTVLESYQSHIAHLQKAIDSRNRDLDHLKTAVKSIMTAIGSNDDPVDSFEIYKVQQGDSLGVIAQKLNKTIREIKDLNGLKSDVIIVGQKLKIPRLKYDCSNFSYW